MMARYAYFVLLVITTGISQSGGTSIEHIQNYNIKTLKNALKFGWKHFCEADVDEGVIAFFPGNNPSDATFHVVTPNNETISLPIKYLSKIAEFGLNPRLRTIIYVNTFLTNNIYDVLGNLQYMQKARRDYNIIVVDFVQNILQLYNIVKHDVFVEGYFVSRLISTLAQHGVRKSDITLVGHSVGANIAALGAALHNQEDGGQKLSALIAIDPARMCKPEDVYVNAKVARRVVVIHGEYYAFGTPEPLGTIDIYPNGNELKYQPGCNTMMCSHAFPFLLFLDSVIDRTSIEAARCESWAKYRRGKCDYPSLLSLGFDFGNVTNGKYFCRIQANQPYKFEQDTGKYTKPNSI